MTESTNVVAVPAVAAVAGVPRAAPVKGEKPEKFIGQNFKRWQQKMMFYLTTLNLARFLTEEKPAVEEGSQDVQAVSAADAWNHSDYLARNTIMNGLSDSLYDVYREKKTAKELWEALDHKYKVGDAGAKKFIVGRFLDFKMVDSKTVVSQLEELQLILHEIHSEGMNLSESFQTTCVIEKLPPSWIEFKNYLKHKRKEMSVEDLILKLRIEEENKSNQKKIRNSGGNNNGNNGNNFEAKANVVEHGQSSKLKSNLVEYKAK